MAAEQAEPDERRLVPMMVIHSINDCTVPIVNGRNLRDSWISYYGAVTEPAAETDCQADGVSCTHSRYADGAGETVVETVIYTGQANTGTHYWPGDNPGEFANPKAPRPPTTSGRSSRTSASTARPRWSSPSAR